MTPWIVLIYIYICYPIGVLGQEKSDAGQPDPPNQPEAKYPSGVAGFSLVCFTHTYIYIYVLDRCLGGNQHRKFAYL